MKWLVCLCKGFSKPTHHPAYVNLFIPQCWKLLRASGSFAKLSWVAWMAQEAVWSCCETNGQNPWLQNPHLQCSTTRYSLSGPPHPNPSPIPSAPHFPYNPYPQPPAPWMNMLKGQKNGPWHKCLCLPSTWTHIPQTMADSPTSGSEVGRNKCLIMRNASKVTDQLVFRPVIWDNFSAII